MARYKITFADGTEWAASEGAITSVEELPPISRKVPPENRVDFTKPIELYYPAEEGDPDCAVTYPCEYVGAVHECSKNFPSWFVCRDLTPVYIHEDGTPGWSEECNLFLVRGDGKTDVFGATVRNKEVVSEATATRSVRNCVSKVDVDKAVNTAFEEAISFGSGTYVLRYNEKDGWRASVEKTEKPKLKLPVKGDAFYMYADGRTAWISDKLSPPSRAVHSNPLSYYDVETGKNQNGYPSHDLVEGPLLEDWSDNVRV